MRRLTRLARPSNWIRSPPYCTQQMLKPPITLDGSKRPSKNVKRALKLSRCFLSPTIVLGLASEQLGRFEDAVEHLKKPLELAQHSLLIEAELGRAYALWGKEAEARQILNGLERAREERYVPAYSLAQIYAGLDDRERALLWLKRANEERSTRMVFVKVDPAFDALRSDPKFQDLLRRARLPARGGTHGS